MRLLKLKLRGAIGVYKGLGREEIEVDFTKFAPGLVALTGKNGSSKTTVLENCHPYRCMVSRSGSLQSHFFLKDSYRILEFDLDGNNYEAKILIDALTGGSEAYLICNGTPINDGKLTTYDEAIEVVLGSQELFFNSVFSGQKSKGIAELKPADRRKLFYELLNLNIYETYLEESKTELKRKELKLAEIEGQINSLSAGETDKEQLEKSRVEALDKIAQMEIEISKVEASIEQSNSYLKDCEIEIAKLEEKQKSNSEYSAKIMQLSKRSKELSENFNTKLDRYNFDLEETKQQISRNQKLLLNKELIDSNIKTIAKYESQITDLKTSKSNLVSQQNNLNKEHSLSLGVLNEKDKKLAELDLEFDKLNQLKENLEKEIENTNIAIKIIDEVPCDSQTGNNCQFLKNAYSSKESLKDLIDKKEPLIKKITELNEEIISKHKKYVTEQNLTEENYNLANERIIAELDSIGENVKSIEDKLNKLIYEADWKQLKKEAQEAETNVRILTEKMENIQSTIFESSKNHKDEIERIANETDELAAKIDNKISEKINEVRSNLEKEEIEREAAFDDLAADKTNLDYYKRSLSDCEAQLEQLKRDEAKVEELNVKKVVVQSEIKDWTFLTKAFDKTGIPVLKLENSGIEITTIANELISLFENKFRIVFETTQLKADKKSYKESFNINIVEEDGVCEISNKSGGQQVYLETAIRLAISSVIKQQGRNLQTSFLDEADGALDMDNAYHYMEMIKRAHNLSGVHNTFIITHRQELLDLLPQKVILKDGILNLEVN